MGGSIWALLVAGSNTWENYRHQADVCHAYQIFHEHNVPDDHIVVMMYDDIAFNQYNPDPGKIINHIHGPNVYPGVPHDYVEEDVTPENFLKVLQGKDMSGIGSGKTIKSGPDDHVFVNYVDHGNVGIVGFPGEGHVLTAKQLNDALMSMYKNNQYKQMVIYVEACHSGSMFEGLLPNDINVYATTASAADEPSYACYFDKRLKVCLGDVYSIEWMKNTDQVDASAETLEQQFDIVKRGTARSHVEQFGNLDFDHDFLKVFMGSKHTLKKFPIPSASTFSTNSQKQNRQEVYPLHSPQQSDYQPNPPNYKRSPPVPYALQPTGTPPMQPPPVQQHQSSNATTVRTQPQVTPTEDMHHVTGDHGLALAVIASFCVFFFGWWVGLACTVPAIFIAISAREAEERRDTATMLSQQELSQGLSTAGMCSCSVIYIIWILAVIVNAVVTV